MRATQTTPIASPGIDLIGNKPLDRYQKFVIALLALLQFTIVLDFMIVSPLGAILMPALSIDPSQFGMVVSAYAFGAGAAGIAAAGFADRFDRKQLLLFFYSGFLMGTLLCGVATNYMFLLGARLVTGLFGGVIGAIVFAIAADLFSYEQRGRVMGVVQTAFAASQVAGIPAGLFFSSHWGWHAPFIMIVLLGVAISVMIVFFLKPIRGHLVQLNERAERQNPFRHLVETFLKLRHAPAFAATALLSTGGFMIMPFASAYTVNNLGVPMEDLPLVYAVTGLCAIVAGPMIGRASDQFGKFKVFALGSGLTTIMILIYTNLSLTPLLLVIGINCLLFIAISSRMISAQALVTGVPDPGQRGAFMAINASLQQLSGGLAALAAGAIVIQGPQGILQRFDILGFIVIASTLICVWLIYLVDRQRT